MTDISEDAGTALASRDRVVAVAVRELLVERPEVAAKGDADGVTTPAEVVARSALPGAPQLSLFPMNRRMTGPMLVASE